MINQLKTHQALGLMWPASPPGRYPQQARDLSAMEQQVIPVWGHCAFQEAAECQVQGPCAFEPAVDQSQSLCASRLAEG